MKHEYALELSYSIKYNTEKPVPLFDIVKALQSLDVLLSGTSRTFSELSGIEVQEQRIFITRVKSGSLREDILVKLIFGNKETYDNVVDWVSKNITMKSFFLGLVLGGAITFGYSALTQNNQKIPSNTNTITGSQNSNIFNIHADVLNDEVKEKIRKAIVDSLDKNKAAKETINFFEPARKDIHSTISLSGDGNFEDESMIAEIPSSDIRKIPQSYKPRVDNEIQEIENATVVLRAVDLDNKKTGWAGRIDGITERVRIELNPSLDPNVLFGKNSVNADVTLERMFNKKENKTVPKRIIIQKVHDE